MEDHEQYRYRVHHNGIELGSDDFDQRFFDRRRKPRLEKKLSVGPHLKVVVFYHMEIDPQTILDRYGVDCRELECFVIEDAIIDLSYVDVEKNIFHPDRFLGFSSSSTGKEGMYRCLTAWEIRVPDADTYQAIVDELKGELEKIIPHRGWQEELPGFISG